MGFSSGVVRLTGSPQADGEYVVLRRVGADEETVHLHDYPRLYAMPGLYEYVVQELLGRRSPQRYVGRIEPQPRERVRKSVRRAYRPGGLVSAGETDGPGGFRTAITRLLASRQLQLAERSRFQHRRSTAGAPIHYELFIATRGPVPALP